VIIRTVGGVRRRNIHDLYDRDSGDTDLIKVYYLLVMVVGAGWVVLKQPITLFEHYQKHCCAYMQHLRIATFLQHRARVIPA